MAFCLIMKSKNYLWIFFLLVIFLQSSLAKQCDKANANIANGRIVASDHRVWYDPMDILRIGCFQGYTRNGNAQAFCLEDGSWFLSPEEPCVGVCTNQPTIPNGYISQSDREPKYTVETSIRVYCDKEYEKHEGALVICKGDDRWHLAPTDPCFRTCSLSTLPHLSRGGSYNTRSNEKTFYVPGDTIDIQCSPPFKEQNEPFITCTNDGSWTSPGKPCEEIKCHPPPTVSFGRYVIEGNKNEEVVRNEKGYSVTTRLYLQCDTGYSPNSSSSIDCTSNGQWSELSGYCKAVQCPEWNETIADQGTTFKYGDKIILKCEEGSMEPIVVNECQSNGSWSKKTCIAAKAQNDKGSDEDSWYTLIILSVFLCIGWLAFVLVLAHYIIFGDICKKTKESSKSSSKKEAAPSQSRRGKQTTDTSLVDNDIYGQHDMHKFRNQQETELVDNEIYGKQNSWKRRHYENDQEELYANL